MVLCCQTLAAQNLIHRVDSFLSARYYREGVFDTTYITRPKTRWTLITRLNFSGNLMVVHTPPGHASIVAYDIDNIKHPYFLGSVAGDDTVIVVLAEGVDREAAGRVVRDIVPKLM